MFVSISSIFVRLLVYLMTFVFSYMPIAWVGNLSGEQGGRTGGNSSVSDSTKVVEKVKGRSVKISISDKGISVKSDSEGNIILEVKEEGKGKQGVEVEDYVSSKESDVIRFGKDIYVKEGEVVTGSVVSFGGDIVVKGKVFGDVVAIGGDINLDSTAIVNGDAVAVFGTIEKEEGAVVRGEVAEVSGAGLSPLIVKFPSDHYSFGFGLFRVGGKIVMFVVLALLLLLVLYLIPDRMIRSADVARRSFFKSMGVGFLILIGGFIVVIILAIIIGITIIGIPISILLVFSFMALIVLGHFVGAFALGEFLSKRFGMETSSIFIKGILGIFFIYLLSLIAGFMCLNPFLGVGRAVLEMFGKLILFVATLVGLGAFVITKAGSPPEEKKLP